MWRLLALLALPLARGDVFTLGYLTGSQRRPGDQEYVRPGLSISGAISLAVTELNAGLMGERGHRLEFVVAETRGDELASIARTADLWTQHVAAYIGPQESCITEARMAASFNLPMISYVSTVLRWSRRCCCINDCVPSTFRIVSLRLLMFHFLAECFHLQDESLWGVKKI
jgi:hypothetical protein